MTLAVDSSSAEDVIAGFGLADLVPRLRAPVLVFGAGRDMVVPAEESIALAAAAGDLATLVWYPDGGHGLYSELDDWMSLTGEWVNGLAGRTELPAIDDLAPEPASEAVRIEHRPVEHAAPPAQLQVSAPAPRSTRVDHQHGAGQPARATVSRQIAQDDGPELDDDLWDE
jgi:hypothetical protein